MATTSRYPTGARPLLVEETARRRRIETQLVYLLEQAGFSEIVLPIIDFADPYSGIATREQARQSYRFVDREGELVAVRSDFTPLVARALAQTLPDLALPLRVFYRGDVVRCETSRLGSDRELFQVGAEIVGDDSAGCDAGVLRLAADLAASFGIEPLVVYTDASIGGRFDARTRAALVTKRLEPDLPPLARKLIAGSARLDDVAKTDAAAAGRLEAIATLLGHDARFFLQLDDFEPSADYYTGLRFRLFGADRRAPIAQGGRYDSLYSCFGADAPAIGFTFTADQLAPRESGLDAGKPQRDGRGPAPGPMPDLELRAGRLS